MKTLYLDCGMGAAGDMLTAALFDLLDDEEKKEFLREANELGIAGIEVLAEAAEKCGIRGTHMKVLVHGEEEGSDDHHHEHDHEHHHDHDHEHHHDHDHDHEHHHDHDHDHRHDHDHEHHHSHSHTSMGTVREILQSLSVSEKVKANAEKVYNLIAEAESAAHGKPVTEIHFHEVGNLDAIADVTCVCLLMEKIGVEKIVVSPVHVGSGKVRCAHGVLPVPAPATAHILKDVPIYGGRIEGELCTPTGAALLKTFATEFGAMPVMNVSKIGYGMGKKDFPVANCVRAMLGDTIGGTDQILELSCNIDDMTPERIGFAMDVLLEAGALDVYTIPIGMKKNRPGILLTVMCREEKRDEIIRLLFRHTTTLGVRENISRRYTMERHVETLHTSLGDVRVKTSTGYGTERKKYEYDDLARLAKDKDCSIEAVVKAIEGK